MADSKIITGKEPCMRCGKDINNEFRRKPWCHECGIELSAMTFNGEDLLEAVLSAIPPLHLQMVEVKQIHQIATKMLIHQGVLIKPLEDDKPKPSILVP